MKDSYYGSLAYAAYVKAGGGKLCDNTKWEDLSDEKRAAWHAAGDAVAERVSSDASWRSVGL